MSVTTISTDERYLSFNVAHQECAIRLLCVKEVIPMPQLTPFPNSPAYFLGITNLRGQIIPILDLRKKLNFEAKLSQETSVIICDMGGEPIGMVVDLVNSVLNPKPEDITPPPNSIDDGQSQCIEYIIKRENTQILLLDLEKILKIKNAFLSNIPQSTKKSA